MIKKAVIGLFLFIFILSPLSFSLPDYLKKANGWYEYGGVLIIDADETWHKNDNLVFDKDIYLENGATLTIEPGAIIQFRRNDRWDAPTLNILGGRILAEGTSEEPIIFTAESNDDTFFINFENTPDYGGQDVLPSFFRYVEISGGGQSNEGGPIQSFYKKSFFFSTALAAEDGRAVFYYQGGKAHFENSRFYDNAYADIEVMADNGQENPDDYLEVVNSNFEGDSDQFALRSNDDCWRYYSDEACVSNIILQDDWYGSLGGPTQDDSLTQKGKRITGQYNLLGWKFKAVIGDPVIIIPGIMGSAEVSGEWKIDPIAHTYDNLIESLARNGYTKDKSLFEFPYDWRKENSTTADFLEAKIMAVKNQTKVSKVDLVAHSMGGLIARSYIERANGESDNVDQLVTLGTPHHGAPQAYLYWEAGEGFFNIKEKIIKHHFTQEAEHNGYDNLYAYIRAEVPSIAELLPDYSYLVEASDQSNRNYPDNYPRNVFLEELNKAQNKEKLNRVEFINIIGDTKDNQGTISGLRLKDSEVDGKWENGMPENFYNNSTDRGLYRSDGDMTVPLSSVSDIESDETITVKASHNDLPTAAQCEVVRELTGEEDCDYTTVFNVTNIFLINVFSPVDIQVVAPDGKRVGKDFSTGEIFNEIDGAYYSGYDTDSEVIAVPNPEDGKYKILTKGTGNGDYRIETSKIIENDENGAESSTEVSESIEGRAQSGKSEEKIATLNGESIKISSAVDINSLLLDTKKYSNRNLIRTKSGAKEILNSLKYIKQQEDKITAANAKTMDEDKKQKELDFLNKNFNRRVDVLLKYLNKSNKVKILDVSIRDTFLSDIESLKKT